MNAVRLATGADRGAVAAMLARAFSDDPAMAYIFPDPVDRARRLPRLFALLFDSDGRAGMRLTSGAGEAATLWRGPGQADTSVWEMIAHAWPLWRALGGSVRRALAVFDAIAMHMPREPVWYLHVAGVDPVAQGRGLGGALTREGLRRVAGRIPVYLETATERNLGFYRSLGFAVVDDWRVPRGGPRFWSMLRAAGQGTWGDPDVR